MSAIIRQTVTYLAITFVLLISLAGIASADDPADSTTPKSSGAPVVSSFSVGDYLNLKDQGAREFGTEEGQISNIVVYVVRLINFLSLTIGSFSFLAIVVGGFLLVTSGGMESQLQRGKDIIKFAIIGLVVALLAFFLVSFVQSVIYEYGS